MTPWVKGKVGKPVMPLILSVFVFRVALSFSQPLSQPGEEEPDNDDDDPNGEEIWGPDLSQEIRKIFDCFHLQNLRTPLDYRAGKPVELTSHGCFMRIEKIALIISENTEKQKRVLTVAAGNTRVEEKGDRFFPFLCFSLRQK
jgi:hypothetical protein